MNVITSKSQHNRLWKHIEKDRCISKDQLRDAVKQTKDHNRFLTEVLLENPTVARERLMRVISSFFNIPRVSLKRGRIDMSVLSLIPREVAEQHSVIAFQRVKRTVHIATTIPENTQTLNFIRKQTGFDIQVYITTPEDIRHALKKYPRSLSKDFAHIIRESMRKAIAVDETAEKMANYVPIIKMVDMIIDRSFDQKASDIHFEPLNKKILVRIRIDGMLQNMVTLPKELHPAVVARLKLMSGLKIDEHRKSQDGRFKFSHDNREVAVRTSIIPTLHGAKVVLRLLDAQAKKVDLENIGLNKRDLAVLHEEIRNPNGMILVTGPTGSGKTTTLYTLLRLLNKEDVNICTVEDPIEYGLAGINQTQIKTEGGITFATGLRSLLRQDPNIIMVGEIRDTEAAEIALQAAMTGQLVLSTLHTNNVFMTAQRLIEMGIQPYLAASVINIIIGQRLVRKICGYCKTRVRKNSTKAKEQQHVLSAEPVFKKLKALGLVEKKTSYKDVSVYYGKGCAQCNGTGYRGRIGIYELLKITPKVRQLILKHASGESIQRCSMKQGVLTMREDGVLKVFEGVTTMEEIIRTAK